jgi:hypothetical protein
VRLIAAALTVAVLALVGAFALATTTSAQLERGSCGVERWPVKTLQDPAGRKLDLTKAKQTSVFALRTLSVERGPSGSRGVGVESTVYQVRARLVEAKVEEDGDIHLVITGPKTTGTMIVEFPMVACASKATQGAKGRIKGARASFIRKCGMPGESSFTKLTGKATIRGVGFFDYLHGQTGVAPNGIELHPVLRFTHATCRHSSTPPPPPPPPPSRGNCAASYPTVCIPPPPPDLDCDEIPYTDFHVRYDVPDPDPHGFDGDRDGIGCET